MQLSKNIDTFFKDALKILYKNPSMALFALKASMHQKSAARTRAYWESQGIQVPPYMVISITNRCNLQCKGCYDKAQHRSSEAEMSGEKLRKVIGEAKDLGVSIILIAGGEPLVRPEILDIMKEHREIIFLLFTNGMLIDDEIIAKFKSHKNIIPVISLEGFEEDTDGRRGKGVYEYIQRTITKIKDKGILFGTSLTVTRTNLPTVTGRQFVQRLIGLGCKLFFFVDYVPFKEGTEDWALTDDQRAYMPGALSTLRTDLQGLFVSFPGDEEEFGGCLSAGRGFIHVSADGSLEPCPFAPFSDTNIKNKPLKEALQSKLLSVIRQNYGELKETNGGCALWQKREWVQSLLGVE